MNLTQAVCREDPDAWTPPGDHALTNDNHPAWNIPRNGCAYCPLRHPCAEWALTEPDDPAPHSMLGGYTPRQRAVLRNARNAVSRAVKAPPSHEHANPAPRHRNSTPTGRRARPRLGRPTRHPS